MLQILVTTVIRSCSDRNNGLVYQIDWEHKRIVHTQILPSPDLASLGPRGGARGARGVVSHHGLFYVANFNTIFVFNQDWRLEQILTHPLFNGIHEIDAADDGLWVTSTGIDAVLKIDWSGQLLTYYSLTDLNGPQASQVQQRPRRMIDTECDYRQVLFANEQLVTHVNSIRLYEGRPYLGTNKQGMIIGLEPMEQELVHAGDQTGFHNCCRISEDLCIALASLDKKILGFAADTGQKSFEFDWTTVSTHDQSRKARLVERIFNQIDPEPDVARSGWTRGLAVIEPPFHYLIGVSPAMIIEINLADRTIIDLFQISDNRYESVHGLTIIDQ
ncbi:hypothetical protein JXQ70_04115 [bacterium]|nr:hypothetical protein [bacterium]